MRQHFKQQFTNIYKPQADLFTEFNNQGVEYLVFHQAAANTYIPRNVGHPEVRVWINPTPDNIEKVNRAIQTVDPATKKAINPGKLNGLTAKGLYEYSKRAGNTQLNTKVHLHGAISGFAPNQFEEVRNRAEATIGLSGASETNGKRVNFAILGISDLHHNMMSSGYATNVATAQALAEHAAQFNKPIYSQNQAHERAKTPPSGRNVDPNRVLTEQERERAVALYRTENPHAGTIQSVQAGKGFQQYVVNNKAVRDLEAIGRDPKMDLEIVVMKYGMVPDHKKNSPDSAWRVYKWPQEGVQERIAIAAMEGHDKKIFVNLGDTGDIKDNNPLSIMTGDKGDFFKFIQTREARNSDRKDLPLSARVYDVIDRIAFAADTLELAKAIPDRKKLPEEQRVINASLREDTLTREYSLRPVDTSDYVTNRFIAPETQMSPEFRGQIMMSTNRGTTAEGKDYAYDNTAFPLRNSHGTVISMDMRNTSFKKFPEGERGEGLWRSNQLVTFTRDLKVNVPEGDTTYGDLRQIPAGTPFGEYRQGNQVIFSSGVNEEVGLNKPYEVAMSLQQAQELREKGVLQPVPANRLVLMESPVDAISHKQLIPERMMADGEAENRRYLATAGQPGIRQLKAIQDEIYQNPNAQVVLAQDGDNAGIRFAINYLRLEHPFERPDLKISPFITYKAPAKSGLTDKPKNLAEHTKLEQESNKEFQGYNRLILVMESPLAHGVNAAQSVNGAFLDKLLDNLGRGTAHQRQSDKDPEKAVQEIRRHTMHLPEEIKKIECTKEEWEKAYARDQQNRLHGKPTQYSFNGETRPVAQKNEAGKEVYRYYQVKPESIRTESEIYIPNDNRLLTKALNSLVGEVSVRQGQEIFAVQRPMGHGPNGEKLKDFNDILKARQGQELNRSNQIQIGPPPRLESLKTRMLRTEEAARQEREKAAAFKSNYVYAGADAHKPGEKVEAGTVRKESQDKAESAKKGPQEEQKPKKEQKPDKPEDSDAPSRKRGGPRL